MMCPVHVLFNPNVHIEGFRTGATPLELVVELPPLEVHVFGYRPLTVRIGHATRGAVRHGDGRAKQKPAQMPKSNRNQPSQHRTNLELPHQVPLQPNHEMADNERRNQHQDQCRPTETTFEAKAVTESDPVAKTRAWPPRLLLSCGLHTKT